jgi:hypothetical protein
VWSTSNLEARESIDSVICSSNLVGFLSAKTRCRDLGKNLGKISGDRLWIPIVVSRIGSTATREVVGRISEGLGRV